MLHSCEHCCTRIENLCVSLNGNPVLEGVNLHINCREVLALIGPNGAGKTTLLRAILGELPYKGNIRFVVKASPGRRPRIGYVPQRLNFEHDSPISVLDLMAMAVARDPVWIGVGTDVRRKAAEALERFSAGHLIDKRIGTLSGGELQRVLLAMAMTPVPDLLLLDEPVSAVDAKGLSLFYKIVGGLREHHDLSIIMATHDLVGIAPYADRMILLNRSIIAEGTPKQVFANQAMLETFPLSLWNISSLPKTATPGSDDGTVLRAG